MTQFLFVRHGETVATKARRLSGGGSDDPLTKKGQEKTRQFLAKLLSSGYDFVGCLTSQLARTKYMGEAFKSVFNKPVFHDVRLAEKHAGVFENCLVRDFLDLGLEEKYVERWYNGFPCGESHCEVAHRVISSLKYWDSVFTEGTVLVASHADVIRSIKAVYSLMKKDSLYIVKLGKKQPLCYHYPYPSDKMLNIKIPHFYTLEIESSRFLVEESFDGF